MIEVFLIYVKEVLGPVSEDGGDGRPLVVELSNSAPAPSLHLSFLCSYLEWPPKGTVEHHLLFLRQARSVWLLKACFPDMGLFSPWETFR